MRLKGRTAFVAGGTRGIGSALARGLPAHGAKVTVADLSLDAAQQVAKEIVNRIATARRARNPRRSLVFRVMMAPLFVAICYLFNWWWLRTTTAFTLLKIAVELGLPMRPLGPDSIALDGVTVQFLIPCTMVDAFFGAIPLLWRARSGWIDNLSRLFAVFAGVFLVNIFRLETGFVALHDGAPWWLAHECVAGVAYFCLFLFIVRQRAWRAEAQAPAEPRPPVAAIATLEQS